MQKVCKFEGSAEPSKHLSSSTCKPVWGREGCGELVGSPCLCADSFPGAKSSCITCDLGQI